jgi:hypothetical protein
MRLSLYEWLVRSHHISATSYANMKSSIVAERPTGFRIYFDNNSAPAEPQPYTGENTKLRSWWPRGLRRMSAAPRLLGLRV